MPKTLFERMSEAQSQTRTILDRMAEAKAHMEATKRRPRAFYLRPVDWAEFMTTGPTEVVRQMWGNNPPVEREDPAFDDLPVRESIPGHGNAGESRLYSTVGSARKIPD